MPRLGLGPWPVQGAECQAAVESAIGLGYRDVDSAGMYGNEAAVGAGLNASGVPREQLYLTTKVWWDSPDGPSFRRAFDACLEWRAETSVRHALQAIACKADSR